MFQRTLVPETLGWIRVAEKGQTRQTALTADIDHSVQSGRMFHEGPAPLLRKRVAGHEALQRRLAEYPTYAHLGQWYNHGALRNNVKGVVASPAPVLWNISVE